MLLSTWHNCKLDDCLTAIRSIPADEFGVSDPVGIAFSETDEQFLLLSASAQSDERAIKLTPTEAPTGDVFLDTSLSDKRAVAYNVQADLLWFYESDTQELVEVTGEQLRSGGLQSVVRLDVSNLALGDARGMAVHPELGSLFVLDGGGRRIVRIDPVGGRGNPRAKIKNGKVTDISLDEVGIGEIRGLAFNPNNGHLYVNSVAEKAVYELEIPKNKNQPPKVVRAYGLSGQPWEPDLVNPQSMVIAPTGDPTDDASRMSLYLVDAGGTMPPSEGPSILGGRILEMPLTPLSGPALTASAPPAFFTPSSANFDGNFDTDADVAPPDLATLVNTIDSSQFTPPSPDSAGITYMEDIDRLLMSDSEVNETELYDNVNLWRMTRTGVVDALGDTTTLSFSDEPTGVSYNPINGDLYVSDDNFPSKIFHVESGTDGIHGTSDDVVHTFEIQSIVADAEGVAYDPASGDVFIVDGIGREVWRFSPGPDGKFDGVGEELVSHFDLEVHGITDPEGIALSDRGSLFIVDRKPDVVIETTYAGTLVRVIDYKPNFTSPYPNASGVVLAPASDGSGDMNLYITDRGFPPGAPPSVNDGKIYEMSIPPGPPLPPDPGPEPGVVLTESDGSTDVVEGGAGDTYTLALQVEPADDVTITVTPDSQTTVSPTTFVFTTTNWNVAQEVTVTAVDDQLVEGGHTSTISHSSSSADPDYNNLAIDDIVANVTDNEVVDVPITIGSDDAEERATGSIDLVGTDLELVRDTPGDQTVGLRFNGITIPRTSTINNATIQFQTDETSSEATSLNIQGQAIDNAPTFTTATNDVSSRARTTASVPWSPPPWDVVGEAGPDQQTPNLAAVVQEIVDRPGWSTGNSLAFIITGTGHRVAESFEGEQAPRLHIDFTRVATLITESGGSTDVTEGGATDAYTMVLQYPPTSDVTITVTPDSQTTVSSSTVVFTTSNWDVPQTVTVTAVDDTVLEGSHTSTIRHSSSSSDPDFDTLSIPNVVAHITDNDFPQVIINQSGGSTDIAEGGATDTYTVVLDQPPSENVTITITPDLESSVSPNSLIFSPSDWDSPKEVTVTAVDDALVQGAHTSTISHTSSSADSYFDGMTIDDVVANVTDNDTAGATISESGGSTLVFEGGAPDTYTVVLDAQPTLNVTITITPDSQTTVSPTSLTFTPAGWNTPQTVTVTAVDDGLIEGQPHPSTITHSSSSSDPDFDSLAISDVVASVTDNDAVTILDVPVAASSDDAEELIDSGNVNPTSPDLEMVNDGGDQTVGVRFNGLNIPPGSKITSAYIQFVVDGANSGATSLTIEGHDVDDAPTFLDSFFDISSRTRTTASVGWSPVPWTVVGEAGFDQQTPQIASIVQEIVDRPGWSVANSMAFIISGTGERVAAAYDRDPAKAPVLHVEYATPGVTITETSGSTDVAEGGAGDTYSVALDSQPTADVTISITPDSQSGVSPSSLVFTPTNWNVPQMVTVTAVNDGVVEGPHTSTITHTSSSSDPDYDALSIADVTANITDNDSATVSIAGTRDGDEDGPVDGLFTLTQSAVSTTDTVVHYSLTRTSSVIIVGGSVTIPAGATSTTITVPVIDDLIVEPTDTVTVTIDNLQGNSAITIGTSNASIDILDNDSAMVSIAGTTNGDEAGPINGLFTVTQSAVSFTDTVVNYSVTGTAESGVDYTALAGSATIPAGTTSTTITVPVLDDAIVEGTETVTLTIDSLGGDPEITIGASIASIDILDNDSATVSIAGTTDGNEAGPVDGLFTVTQSAASPSDTVVHFSVSGTAESGVDYTAFAGSVTIPVGTTSATITVPVLDDAIVEGTETVTLTIDSLEGNSEITIGTSIASIDILDNDSATVGIAGTTNGDEAGPIDGVFTVTQSAVSSTDTVVHYSVTGTADSGDDYTALTGSVTIGEGTTSATITVPVLDDAIVEGTETVTLTIDSLEGNSEITIGASIASIDILDNDSATVGIAGTTNGNEAGPVNGLFTLTQSAASSSDTVVHFSVSGTAESGVDYTALAGSATIPAGTTSTTITVPVVDDAIVEGTETVTLTIDSLGGDPEITIGTSIASIDILDNDTATISIDDVSLAEGNAGTTSFTFTVSMDHLASKDITVVANTNGVTATGGGTDYADVADQTVTVSAGSTAATLTVDVTGELLVEPDEIFEVNLTDAKFDGVTETLRAVIGDAQGIGTIQNDDSDLPAAEVDIEKYVRAEPSADLCVRLDKPRVLTMEYIGGDATSHSQDEGKVVVTGTPGTTSPVHIVASSKLDLTDKKAKIWFEGTVSLHETFDIDAAADGKDDLSAETFVQVFTDSSMATLLQTVEFHTSCSQPLALGDIFGAVQLVDFTDRNGESVGPLPGPVPGVGDADSPPGVWIEAGSQVVFTYVVTNPGRVPLTNVVVTDDNATPGDPSDDFNPTFVSGDTDSDGLLDSGEQWQYVARTVAVVGQFTNIGVVSGTPSDNRGNPVGEDVSDADPAHWTVLGDFLPAVDIEKATNAVDPLHPTPEEDADTQPGPILQVGDTVTHTYVVTNPGNVPLANVVVTDDNGTPVDQTDDFRPAYLGGDDNNDGWLDLDEIWVYESMQTVIAGQHRNDSHVVGEDPAATAVSDVDPSHHFGVVPVAAIDLETFTRGHLTAATNSNLCYDFGRPQVLTMQYTGDGDDATSHGQDAGKVEVVGDPNEASPVFIVASSKLDLNDKKAKVYFEGMVALGEIFAIDAAFAGDSHLSGNTYVQIFSDGSMSNLLQAIKFKSDCREPLLLGDQFGALRLFRYLDESGNGTDLGVEGEAAEGPDIHVGDTIIRTYVVTNIGNQPLQDVLVVDDNATPGGTSPATDDDFNPLPILDSGFNIGDLNADGVLDTAEQWLYQDDHTVEEEGEHTSTSEVTATTVIGNETVTDTDVSNYIGVPGPVDVCSDGSRPQLLSMQYTGDGDDATSHSQDPGKVEVIGDPADASPVFIVASNKLNLNDKKAKIWYEGTVNLDEAFSIDAAFAGDNHLSGTTYVQIFADNTLSNLLQSVEFKTDCSEPLLVDDQFGGVRVVGFISENGSSGGLLPAVAASSSGAYATRGMIASYLTGPVLTIRVDVDVKPGNDQNPLNLKSQGVTTVAVLSSDTFDATKVDPLSVLVSGAGVALQGNGEPQATTKDVNHDGLVDLEVKVQTEDLQLSTGEREVQLEATTFDGTHILGTDAVRVVASDDDSGGSENPNALRVREPVLPAAADVSLTEAMLSRATAEAVGLWQAVGADARSLSALDVQIGDLSDSLLGWTDENAGRILIDRDAAGYGWSIGTSANAGGVDLPSVIAHEIGHVLGLDHVGMGLGDTLDVGVRQLPVQLARPGDANQDGTFDRFDIIQVLDGGTYRTGQPSGWKDGDFDGDGAFDQRDLVAALQQGDYAPANDRVVDEIFAQLSR